jgi:gliding motility-associated-like protein
LAYGCVDLYFRREIVLPATDDCGVPIEENYCLTLSLFADNNIYAVSVNGVKYYQHQLTGDPYKYNGVKNEVHLNLCQGWGEGINTILVHVKSCPTLAGLLIQGVPTPEKTKTFLGKDTVLCSSQSFALVSPWENTSWYDDTIGKTKIVDQDGNYWAKYTDKDGCTILDTIAVRFGLKSYVPGAFSPNQDGINDCFVPLFSNKSFTLYEFRVFDRLGTLVYQTTDPSACWDGQSRGKPCAEGIYVYAILLQNGECASTVVKGALTLLR